VNPSPRPVSSIPDIAGSYATRVRELLASRDEHMTAAEITSALGCNERRVREALDRLVFCSEVEVELRHTPGKRGALPRAYRLKRTPSAV
jgi:predicted ArsR family transcriptional regulator